MRWIRIHWEHICIFIPNKKSLWLPIWPGQQNKKYQDSCHLKTISQNDYVSNVHLFRAYVDIHTKYEVSIFNLVARRAVHRHRYWQCWSQLCMTDKSWLWWLVWYYTKGAKKSNLSKISGHSFLLLDLYLLVSIYYHPLGYIFYSIVRKMNYQTQPRKENYYHGFLSSCTSAIYSSFWVRCQCWMKGNVLPFR